MAVSETLRIPPEALYLDDEEGIREIFWLIRPDDTVVDVGAGYGAYTLPALAAGARVYAIDSNQKVLSVLSATADLNGFTDLTTLHMAVFDGSVSLPLALKRQHHRSTHSPSRAVHWATLDGLCAGGVISGGVDWLKIDVEGAELGVLQRAQGLLARDHPQVIVEDHSKVYEWVHRIRSTSKIAELLHKLGYRIELVPYLVPGTPSRDFLVGTWHG